MIKITQIRMNYGLLKKTGRYRITECRPTFSWGVVSNRANAVQAAYCLSVAGESGGLWDSGWVQTADQQASCGAENLPAGERLTVRVAVRDDSGEESAAAEQTFYVSGLTEHVPGWIAAPEDKPGCAVYFRRDFALKGKVKSAVLYACGLGYHQITLNGKPVDSARLDPAVSDYSKTCYYVMLPDIQDGFSQGSNCLCVALGEGWRRNEGHYLKAVGDRKIDFFGIPQFSASLSIQYADGSSEVIDTDENWLCCKGPVIYNNLFDGETYDARETVSGWNRPGKQPKAFRPARAVPGPGGAARTMTLEPIVQHEEYEPKTITPLDDNAVLVDFGQNIAGVCRLQLPQGMSKGSTVTMEHMEFLDEDGRLYLPNLRAARCKDVYIAAGDERDLTCWQPSFTYHGFRYAQITGCPLLEKDDIRAVSLYTDVAADSFFSCGSALVNAIQKNVVQTEKSNIMGILTDCPQRDERMGWMNDATVRFEETPYNFDIGRLFPKVIQDLLDAQSEDGAITCTAPYVYGSRPADPVCSSFLMAGLESWLHCGNTEIIRKAFDGFARWEECLAAHAENHIVNYSYYGDWAGPVYACKGGKQNVDAVISLKTPGIFMSTGYYYLNAVLLSKFAGVLGRTEDEKRFAALAQDIKQAILEKWWDGETGKMATGSQGCQSFSLWLGIIPEDKRILAAQRLHENFVGNHYRFTTGNLCTRYLMDELAEYGYIDDAWRIVTSEEYASFGYMIQNEATTVWERFELKKNPGMNSHNHPMYGAVGFWFYAYIAGIKPTAAGFSEVDIHPFFPKKLLSANAKVSTVKGDLAVRWVKRYGKLHLYVTVPFGVRARVFFDGKQFIAGSGFSHYEAPLAE